MPATATTLRPRLVSDKLQPLIEPLLPVPGPKLVKGETRASAQQAVCGILFVLQRLSAIMLGMIDSLGGPYHTALQAHAQRYLGRGYACVSPVGDGNFSVGLHRDDRTGLVSALTLGVPLQPSVIEPVEFACTLQTSQEREAYHLARVAARCVWWC